MNAIPTVSPADAGQKTSSPELKTASLVKLQNQSARPDILTDETAAAELFVEPRTIRAWRMAKGLPYVRLSAKVVRIRRADLDKWIARHATNVELRLDSPGGDSTCGIKIHDALRERVTTATITGRCGSAGLIAVMGAQKISCISTARLLVHQPVSFVLGNAGQLRFAADGLEKTRTRFEQIISDRTKQPIETVRQWVAGETFFSAQEALAVGLVDEIFTAPEVTPGAASDASDTPGQTVVSEKEEMFRAWLRAFGKVPVVDKERFVRDLVVWANQNAAAPTTPASKPEAC